MQMDTLSVGEKKLASFFPSLKDWDGRFTPDSTQATAIYHIRRNLVRTYDTFSDAMNIVGADPRLLASITPEPSPQPWGVAGAVTVPHPLAALGMKFLSGTTFVGDGDAYTVRVQNNGTSQSFRAVWDVGNWDSGGMIVPQGESGQPGSKHYTDQAAAWSAGKLPAIPFSDAAVAAATVDHLTLTP
jgi:acyl-homoserine lactone acylase PvdQ